MGISKFESAGEVFESFGYYEKAFKAFNKGYQKQNILKEKKK